MQGGGGNVERRPGDWDCGCGELNFASRVQCRKCHADRRTAVPGTGPVRAMSGGVPAAVPNPVGQEQPQQPVRHRIHLIADYSQFRSEFCSFLIILAYFVSILIYCT